MSAMKDRKGMNGVYGTNVTGGPRGGNSGSSGGGGTNGVYTEAKVQVPGNSGLPPLPSIPHFSNKNCDILGEGDGGYPSGTMMNDEVRGVQAMPRPGGLFRAGRPMPGPAPRDPTGPTPRGGFRRGGY